MWIDKKALLNYCFGLKNAMMLAVLLLRCMQRRKLLKREMDKKKAGDVCRACMGQDCLKPIFDEKNGCDSIWEQLAIASGLQISKDDGLPQQLCEGCIKEIENAIKFRDKCKDTETRLLNLKKTETTTLEDKIAKNEKRLRRVYKKKIKLKKRKKRDKDKIVEDKISKDNSLQEDNDAIEDKAELDFEMDYQDDYMDDYGSAMDPTSSNDIVELYHKDPGPNSRKEEPVVPITLKCNICEKILKNRNTYLKHMIVHTGDYPYMCEQCGKGLMAYTHLVSHMKAKHGWERTDKCSYCGYLALNKSILQIHERRHTGEKPFVCDHCGMGFHRRANLLQHLPVHLTTKTVQCSLCPSAFKSIRFLRTHYNKKHKQKKYTYLCHICKNYFKTTGNVRMHLFRIHGIPKEDQGPVHRMLITDTYLN